MHWDVLPRPGKASGAGRPGAQLPTLFEITVLKETTERVWELRELGEAARSRDQYLGYL